jgi:hypothetical protein
MTPVRLSDPPAVITATEELGHVPAVMWRISVACSHITLVLQLAEPLGAAVGHFAGTLCDNLL